MKKWVSMMALVVISVFMLTGCNRGHDYETAVVKGYDQSFSDASEQYLRYWMSANQQEEPDAKGSFEIEWQNGWEGIEDSSAVELYSGQEQVLCTWRVEWSGDDYTENIEMAFYMVYDENDGMLYPHGLIISDGRYSQPYDVETMIEAIYSMELIFS